eukprot:scaffold22805_cov59-Phaeocystis_antarctica.AAC.9
MLLYTEYPAAPGESRKLFAKAKRNRTCIALHFTKDGVLLQNDQSHATLDLEGAVGASMRRPDRPTPAHGALMWDQARPGVTPTRPQTLCRRWSPAGGRRWRCPGPRTG